MSEKNPALPESPVTDASPEPWLSLVDGRDSDRSWELRYPPPAAAAVLSALLDALAEASTVREVAREIVGLAVEFCPPVDSASITAVRRQTLMTLASTDERALLVDGAQYHEGRGPCVSAVSEERMMQVTLPRATQAGPEWRRLAQSYGFRRITSLPVPVPSFPAALNLYSQTTTEWLTDSRDIAETLAVYGADTLAVAARFMPDGR